MLMFKFGREIKGCVPGTTWECFAVYTSHRWVGKLFEIFYKLCGWKLEGIAENQKYIWD